MELIEIAQDEEKKIICVDVNKYYFYDQTQKNQQIIGMFTDGIFTCSSIVLSFNNDEYLFFAHIHEQSKIIETINNIMKNKIKNKKIDNISIVYSKGEGTSFNYLINYDIIIDKIIDSIKKYFNDGNLKITRTVKTHKDIISCLKIIVNNQQNDYLDIIKKKYKNLFFDGKKNNKFIKYINSQLKDFNNSFDKVNNICYYIDYNRLAIILNLFETLIYLLFFHLH